MPSGGRDVLLTYPPLVFTIDSMLTPTRYMPTATEQARDQLRSLQAERAAAALAGLTSNETYMAELELDLAAAKAAFVGAAVTEIAALRARLDAPLQG